MPQPTTGVGNRRGLKQVMRVLICDDSAEARRMLRTMLAEDRNLEIVGEASDGGEAIALGVHLMPDVVLMDVAMPVVDGVEATRRIRELVPGTRVVALAGSNDLEVGEPLVRLAHSLGRALPGGIGQLLARELVELTGALCAAAYLTSSDAGLSLAGIAGAPTRDRLTNAPGVALRAFTEAVAASADAHELAELYRLGVPCGHALAVPLVADGTRLGALLVAMPASVQLELEEQLVRNVADLAAASLAQERRLALTFAEARRDAHTGLPNRRAFDEHLEEMLAQAGMDYPIAVAMFDVDEFKSINDTGGHAAGDEVLAT